VTTGEVGYTCVPWTCLRTLDSAPCLTGKVPRAEGSESQGTRDSGATKDSEALRFWEMKHRLSASLRPTKDPLAPQHLRKSQGKLAHTILILY